MSGRPAADVSVVIPAYNSEGFIAETIDSVYAQTVLPAEVIVVDDGSTDGTSSLLGQLAGRLPATFRWVTQKNGGEASARNLGVRLATGRFVAFLDHDDLWHPEKLARQLDQFAADPELSVSFTALTLVPYERADDGSLRPHGGLRGAAGPLREVPERGVQYLHKSWDPDPQPMLQELMSHSPIGSASTVLVRREALDRVPGFSESRPISDDWLMWLNMAAAGSRFGHVPEALVEYRWHESNLSGYRLRRMNSHCAAFDQFLATNELPRRTRRQLRLRWWCAHRHLIAAIAEAQAGDGAGARRHILRAARVYPPSIRPGWVRMLGIGPAPRVVPPARDSGGPLSASWH